VVAEPQLVLFDEPLSNLDAKLRERMRIELRSLQRRLGFTAVYVTHDQTEALALSDQLIIMNEGIIEQQGTPKDTYKKPITPFVADFMGSSNLIQGRIIGTKEPEYVIVDLEEVDTKVTCSATSSIEEGMPVMISFRPENAKISRSEEMELFSGERAEMNLLPGQIEAALFLGEYFEYSIKVGSSSIKIYSSEAEEIPVETPIFAAVAPEHCLAIPRQ
jgi:iron(III) transport system ATP-binding protein